MLFQRIRQVNVEAFRLVRLIAGFFEQQIQFRMRHCIRRHQQLEPVQARQQVIFDIAAPCALHHFEARDINSFDDFDEKRAGADARIEKLHFMHITLNRRGAPLFLDFDRDGGRVGQALRQAKFALNQVIYGADDEFDDRRGRVPNAPAFAEFWVIRSEERFVKMDDRIGLLRRLREMLEQRVDIRRPKDFREVVHRRFDALVNLFQQNILKQFAQKRVGLGDKFRRFLARERIRRGIVQPRRKEAVGERLRVQIGKLARREVVNQNLLKRLELVFQRGLLGGLRVRRDGLLQNGLQQPRFRGHQFRQF